MIKKENGIDPRTLACKEKYEGKQYKTKGSTTFTILQFNSAADVLIQFDGSDYQIHTTMYRINKGIRDPFEKSCIAFTDPKKQYEGGYVTTNQGYTVQILEYKSSMEVVIKFLDSWGYITTVTLRNLMKGEVRNPFHPNKFGGFLGVGKYNGDEYDWLYRIWYNMLMRANGSGYYSKYHDYPTSAYDNAYMDQCWLNYNLFAEWYTAELSKLNPIYNYEIDKDILYPYYSEFTNGKKCYGPNCCVLVPGELNTTIVANKYYNSFNSEEEFFVYKNEKEKKIKSMAEAYYKNNGISEVTYLALMGYRVEPGDLRVKKNMDEALINRIKEINGLE